MQLIDTIKEDLLKSAKLTGLWENKLRKIERGEFSAQQFLDELKEMVSKIVINVLSDNDSGSIIVDKDNPKPRPKAPAGEKKPRAARIKSVEQIVCPVCGKGHLIKGKAAYGCSEFRNGCHTVFPFSEFPANLSPARLRAAINKKYKKQ